MKFVSVRELRNRPGAVWKELDREDLVLTANGKPVGILIGLEDDDLETTLETLRRSRASLALSRLRKHASESGLDRLGDEEIDREVRATRRQRQRS